MKAMNLVPVAERRQSVRLTNLSPATLLLIGGLCAALAVVAIVVTLGSRIDDRQAATADLQAQTAQKQAEIDAIVGQATTLEALEQAASTVRTLDSSRYDWPALFSRVSSSLPAKVKMTTITSSLGGGTNPAAAAGAGVQFQGCADSLRTLAGAMQRIRRLNGIESVTLSSATKGQAGACPYTRSFQLSVGITPIASATTTASASTGSTTGGTP